MYGPNRKSVVSCSKYIHSCQLAGAHTASMRIVWRTDRNGKHAGASDGHFVMRGGGGCLGGGSDTGDNEESDESADGDFHVWPQSDMFL